MALAIYDRTISVYSVEYTDSEEEGTTATQTLVQAGINASIQHRSTTTSRPTSFPASRTNTVASVNLWSIYVVGVAKGAIKKQMKIIDDLDMEYEVEAVEYALNRTKIIARDYIP